MALTALIGCWFGILRIAPHVAILLTGVFVAAVSALLVLRIKLANRARSSRAVVYLFTAVAWFYLYVLSIGPVVALGSFEGGINFVYAPVIWLHDTTPLEKPLEQYGRLWGWR